MENHKTSQPSPLICESLGLKSNLRNNCFQKTDECMTIKDARYENCLNEKTITATSAPKHTTSRAAVTTAHESSQKKKLKIKIKN